VFEAVVDCSTGTYIRSLAADLGTALGGGAHVRNLRRTSVGRYTLDDAVPLDQISLAAVRPPVEALSGMATRAVSDELAAAVGHGKVLSPDELGVDGAGPWGIVAPDGRLLAVYEACPDGRVKPTVVLAAPEPPQAADDDQTIGRSRSTPR
jgi:tRNA pseudouridine55 synthase